MKPLRTLSSKEVLTDTEEQNGPKDLYKEAVLYRNGGPGNPYNCKNGKCSFKTGECKEGCLGNYWGPKCDKLCSS